MRRFAHRTILAAGALSVSIYVFACSSSDSSDSTPSGAGGAAQTGGSPGAGGTAAHPGSGGSAGTGGSPSAAPSILEDASWSLTATRTPTTLTWTDGAGHAVQSRAIAGEIEILVDPLTTTRSAITATIQQHNGTLFAALPRAGLYWARVPAGQEPTFIDALRPDVIDVLPNLAVASRQDAGSQNQTFLTLISNYQYTAAAPTPLPVTSGNLVLDFFGDPLCLTPDCSTDPRYVLANPDGTVAVADGHFVETMDAAHAASHGQIVDFYRTNQYALYDDDPKLARSTVTLPGAAALDDIFLAAASMIDGAAVASSPATINMSLGSIDYQPGEVTSWEAYNQNDNRAFYESLAALLDSDARGTAGALVVQAAPDTPTDLTAMLVNEHTLHPTSSSQILLVGALDAAGMALASYSGYSGEPGTMVYVPVGDATDKGTLVQGTSFAAPQIEYLVAQLRARRPDLGPAQIRAVLLDETVAPPRAVQRPNAPIGDTIVVPVIDNPLDPAVLAAAVAAADQRFPANPGADAGADDAGMPSDDGAAGAGPADGGGHDASPDNACCSCNFDVYCTAFGAGGCWKCHNAVIVSGVCQAPSNYLNAPGACMCDPGLYQICE